MNRVECGSIAGERRALESVALKGLGESLGSEAEVTAAATINGGRVCAHAAMDVVVLCRVGSDAASVIVLSIS